MRDEEGNLSRIPELQTTEVEETLHKILKIDPVLFSRAGEWQAETSEASHG